MPNVKVWNDNTYPYTEEFRDKKISIPAKGFIMMDEGEAQIFRGTFSSIKTDADGNHHPSGFKMIRLETVVAEEQKPAAIEWVCQMDGAKFATEEELNKYIQDNYKEKIFVDPEAEAQMKKKGKPSKAA